MPFAPSLGLAFLYGEGKHGWWNEQNGRYMDDLWAYDVMANRWVNVYPGTDINNPPKLVVRSDGLPALENGDAIPIGQIGHGYAMTTWDPDRKALYSLPSVEHFIRKALPEIAAFYDRAYDKLEHVSLSPWIYDLKADKWERHRSQGISPESDKGAVALYIPTLKKVFVRSDEEIWLYNPAINTWQSMTPSGPPPPFGMDTPACYDFKRDRVYLIGGKYPEVKEGNAFWIYDVQSNRWIDPEPAGKPGPTTDYSTNRAMMHYDMVNDVVLLVRYADDDRGISAYSPATNTWTSVADHLPGIWPDDYKGHASSGFYDPALNAHFFHVAGDSRDNGIILVYRYGKPDSP